MFLNIEKSRTRLRMFSGMVGEYGPRLQNFRLVHMNRICIQWNKRCSSNGICIWNNGKYLVKELAQVAQQCACRTHDLVVLSSIPG